MLLCLQLEGCGLLGRRQYTCLSPTWHRLDMRLLGAARRPLQAHTRVRLRSAHALFGLGGGGGRAESSSAAAEVLPHVVVLRQTGTHV